MNDNVQLQKGDVINLGKPNETTIEEGGGSIPAEDCVTVHRMTLIYHKPIIRTGKKLHFYYGPTEWNKDRGTMWCSACDCEEGMVFAHEGGYSCLNCELSWNDNWAVVEWSSEFQQNIPVEYVDTDHLPPRNYA